MNLQEQAAQFVTERGPEAIAKALDVSFNTVKTWQKMKKYPVTLIQYMMDEGAVQTSGMIPGVIPEEVQETASEPSVDPLLGKVVQVLADISGRLAKIEEANFKPLPKPQEGPRVVRREEAVVPTHFEEVKTLGGNKPYEEPPETHDHHGVHMSQLLAKKKKPEELLAEVLNRLVKQEQK